MYFVKTNSQSVDFQKLVHQLDIYLSIINGENDSFFKQFNKIDTLNNVILAFENDVAVGCGAIKAFNANTMEIKRMYVVADKRGLGIASKILKELEKWSIELGFEKCILETNETMNDAIALYQKNNYKIIPNYGQYIGVSSSICFEKKLK